MPDKMDEFEDADFPFDSAGTLSMGQLRNWPGLSKNFTGTTLAADPGAYRRWDLEAIYHHNLKGSIGGLPLRSLEFQYRHFQELSPKAAIEAAGLDRHRLGTVRLNLGDDKFIAYSRGRLPFDKQSDRAVKIGVAFKFP